MAWLGIVIFIFLIIHMWQFWLQMKLGKMQQVTYPGMDHTVADLYTPVLFAFKDPVYVFFYALSMIIVGYHLWHGVQSSFQSLGWSHARYTRWIRFIGGVLAWIIPLGFAYIPLCIFFCRP
jgi:succinate dehydrogenase / fumarate reductase cytochrome b subunit